MCCAADTGTVVTDAQMRPYKSASSGYECHPCQACIYCVEHQKCWKKRCRSSTSLPLIRTLLAIPGLIDGYAHLTGPDRPCEYLPASGRCRTGFFRVPTLRFPGGPSISRSLSRAFGMRARLLLPILMQSAFSSAELDRLRSLFPAWFQITPTTVRGRCSCRGKTLATKSLRNLFQDYAGRVNR